MPRPRRVSRDVFSIDRPDTDRPAEAPQPALGGLLTRVAEAPVESPATDEAAASESAGKSISRPYTAPVAPRQPPTPQGGAPEAALHAPVRAAAGSTTPNRPRAKGGRPTASEQAQGLIAAKIPARVPAALYGAAVSLVKGANCPSWGQLIAWTCEDNPQLVRSAVSALTTAAGKPRRVRGQNRAGTASMLVTARLNAEELVIVEALREDLERELGHEVTRTMVVLGALTAATTA